QVEEVVIESTAQYWKPLWSALERYWKPTGQHGEGAEKMSGTLHLAQALSHRGRRGRKKDFRDAQRLVKRLVSQELTLSFVPDAEQRRKEFLRILLQGRLFAYALLFSRARKKLGAALVSGCLLRYLAVAQSISANYAPGVNFSKFHTYWVGWT